MFSKKRKYKQLINIWQERDHLLKNENNMRWIFAIQIRVGVMNWTPSYFMIGVYLNTVSKPIPLKMIILFRLVIHLLEILPREIKYEKAFILKVLCLKINCSFIMIFSEIQGNFIVMLFVAYFHLVCIHCVFNILD